MIRPSLAAVLMIALGTLAAAAEPARPNVLLIVADDMGFSDAGCYGGEIATPNLDALAKGGLRFTQFYNTSRCWPTRAAVLTGYYAQQVRRDTLPGIKSGSQGTRPAWARLLPELLRPLGYRSYHSGKWHIDGKPLDNGFDRSYSLNDHNRHFTPRQHTEDDRPLPPVDAKAGYYSSTAIADHAIKCLKEHAEKYADRPFFEFLAFTAPHFPVQAPPDDVARYRKTYLAGWDAMREQRWKRLQELHIGGTSLSAIERDVGPPYSFPDALKKLGPNEVNRPLPWNQLTPEQRAFQADKMAVHAAMVDRMDREIGRVLDQLRAMGAIDNTLILFLSDNGASAEIMVRGDGHDPHAECGTGATFLSIGPGWSSLCNTPFRRHKTWVHEGGIATPLIAHWPKGIAARGELRHAPGHVIDLPPTILELAGGKWPQEAPPSPGKGLVPVFAKDTAKGERALWWLHEGNKALRAGDWKLVAAKDGPWELYDLASDRSEEKNLAQQRPEKVRELAANWTKQLDEYAALGRKDLPPPKPKNIVWIIVDDMSANFSCYGEKAIRTPHVDRLAAEGTRFARAFVTAPVCSPCRSALITGCYQTTIGAHHHRSGRGELRIRLPGDVVPVPLLFQKAGYYTCIGGFGATGEKLGKTDYNFEWPRAMYDGNDWAGRRPGQPFFMQVQLHGGKYRGQGPNKNWQQRVRRELGSNTRHEDVTLPPYYPRDPVILQDWADYLDCCRYTDKEVGEVIARLENEKLLDDTVIFFMTDHGISHARGKQFLYDEGTHVPLVVRGPGVAKGVLRNDLVEHIDLAATSLALAGIEVPKWMQGRDILARDYGKRDAVFAARDRCDETMEHLRSVRTERFKYIRNYLPERPHLQPNRYKDDKAIVQKLRELHAVGKLNELQEELLFAPKRPPEELYDLMADAHEVYNLAGDANHKATLEAMRKRLADWEERTGDKGRTPEPMAMYDSDMKEYLSGGAKKALDELRRNIELNKKWASEGK